AAFHRGHQADGQARRGAVVQGPLLYVPQIVAPDSTMCCLVQARPVKTVIINTNGIRLASDRRFVDQLATRNRPGHPVHIYLQ
ncbi:hypothetical protein, partial [Mycobacterium tuberculosis]|uniref:hypothetical protein n=1 Tax=Mycobacterium tuberculosis TaxID=1773 RepID=UPI001244F365